MIKPLNLSYERNNKAEQSVDSHTPPIFLAGGVWIVISE